MSIFIRTPKPNEHARILADLRRELEELSLPENLKVRLLRDSDGGPHYRRLLSIADLDAMPPNSSYIGFKCGGCCCRLTILVEAGNVALMNDNGVNFFLAPGYHSVPTFGVEINEAQVSLATVNRAVTCGTVGFITITEGNIGVMMLGSEYKLLAPGTYEWNSPVVGSVTAVDIRKSASQLGPFSLVTVSEGNAAVTYHHGSLKILGWSAHEAAEHATPFASTVASRTFFMDDPNWVHKSFLSTHIQTDRLEGNDLLSKDNVELIMVAMSQWRIVNPHLAITHCGHDMTAISTKVDQLVRATIARIVAATCIGAGPVGGHMARPVGKAARGAEDAAKGVAAGGGDADMAHLMQSPEATQFMAELTHNMQHMGIEVVGVYVPEKRIKNDDTRSEIAKQAVIGIKAEAQRAAADASSYATIKAAQAESEADRARADAKAYVTVTVARADAVAIAEVAQAHSRAGELLGPPTNTAARLALSEKTGKALENANVTIFSGAPSMMPFMFSGEPGRS